LIKDSSYKTNSGKISVTIPNDVDRTKGAIDYKFEIQCTADEKPTSGSK